MSFKFENRTDSKKHEKAYKTSVNSKYKCFETTGPILLQSTGFFPQISIMFQRLYILIGLLQLTVLYGVRSVYAAASVEGDCISNDKGLTWLAPQLSPSSFISCAGSPLQLYNAGRYWGEQFGKNASVVVFPASAADVASTIKAAGMSPLGTDFAFVSGGHGM